jgi:hypothetical protein
MDERLADGPEAGASGGGATGFESPSLFAAGTDGPPAFELKFLLTEPQAAAVVAAVAGRLALDPHADPDLGNAYLTTSVYTDTPDYAVFLRTDTFGGCKFRVRRYGPGGPVFVERKQKTGDRVRKQRSRVTAVNRLAGPVEAGWPGAWFHRELLDRGLRPVCRVSYERVAYAGTADSGPVRLTFDRRVRGELADGWHLTPVTDAPALLDDLVICEFKFRLALPALFKGIVADLGLSPSAVSKYRRFLGTARGLPVGGTADA